MKILFVQDSLGTGGAERSNAFLWHYLRKRGIDLKVVVLERRKQGVQKDILENNFPVTFLSAGSFLQNSRDIAAIIREYEPTLVHSVLFKSNMRVRAARLFTSFYHVESLVNCTYDPIRLKDQRVNKMGFYLAKFLDFLSAPLAVDHSIAITHEVARHYEQQLRIPSKRLSVISRGRAANEHLSKRHSIREQLNKELGIAPDKVLLIHVGRQEFQKGHLDLLKALLEIYKRSPQSWQHISMLFCGRKGNATADIEAFLERHPYLKENLHFLGHRSDVPQLLAGSDVFVFPSLYEGLGGALIEAQAAALPIVCSDIAVLHEVVNKDENALMFPVTNSEALCDKLLQIIEDDELRQSMQEKSLRNYRANFKLDRINEEMLEFYRNASGGKAKVSFVDA